MQQIECLYDGLDLAEAPRLTDGGEIYFSDAFGGGIFRRSPDGKVDAFVPDLMMVAGLVLNDDGNVVAASLNGLELLDPRTGQLRNLGLFLDGKPLKDVNDIEADVRGNIYGGVIDRAGMAEGLPLREWAVGQLFRVDVSGSTTVVGELRNPNGLAFSPDEQILYIVESGKGVWAFDVGQDGSLRNQSLFTRLDGATPDDPDGCDGLTVDSEGNVLVACVATSEIVTIGPDGVLRSRLKMDVQPTSLEFGGDDLRDLYVTTGHLSNKGAGKLLHFRTDIPGRPSHPAKLQLDEF